MSDSDAELGALAERLAREGGEIARRGSSAIATHMAADTKSSSVDLVTEYDRAAEAHIVAELRHHRPDDAIVGEEGSADGGTSGLTWFIDPIDGTTNFVYGQPAWACSVAVERDGSMLAAAVSAPVLGEMFTAVAGHGARLNGEPISVSTTADLSSTLVGTGFSYLPERRTAQAVVVAQLISEVRDIRRLGSAAYDLCLVACGRLDVYYERHLNSWDAAAGELIVREAGGVTSDYSGGTARPEEMVAANADIHGPFLAALAPFREPPAGRS
jgi:myo-inositol-1(or 4)-monophosphatase